MGWVVIATSLGGVLGQHVYDGWWDNQFNNERSVHVALAHLWLESNQLLNKWVWSSVGQVRHQSIGEPNTWVGSS